MIKRLLLTVLTIFSFCITQTKNTPKYLDTSLDFEERALDLVEQMTLEEKISQLGKTSPSIPRLGIPEYDWWNECLHGVARAGVATVFPQAIGMAASFNPVLMKKVADVISDEARAKHHEAVRNGDFGRYTGLTMWSPNINIFRDPRWGRGHETYGEDPYLTGEMGKPFVRGLQGDHPKYLKLVATAKHYAVHNGPEPDRHRFNAVPNVRDLWETYLPAFKDLMVDAKSYSIMSAYNRVDGESSSASWLLLQDILRNKWGFDGYVVSDCGAIRDIHAFHKVVNTPEEAAAVGVRKGCDLNCGGVYQTALKKAIEKGFIDEGELDLALYRLVLARMKLGMFDPQEIVPFAQIPYEKNDTKEHSEVSLKMAQESMTLLTNKGILPLNKNIKKIAVVGPNAKNIEALRGNYYGDASEPVHIIDGIRKRFGKNAQISFANDIPLVVVENDKVNYKIIDSKYLSTKNSKGKKVKGLKAEFFNNINLEGKALYTKIDKQINFNWKASPTETELAQGIITAEKSINKDEFSIRWTGQLTCPKSGKYKLGAVSDDGCRVWLNNKLIADGWSDHGMDAFLKEVDLKKGKTYDIKIEYYDNTQNAGIKFVWEAPQKKKIKKRDPLKLTKKTLQEVKNADVAIFVGGLDATWEGEEMGGRTGIDGFYRGDRTKIELPKTQLDALKEMKKTGTPIIFVMMAGSAISFDGFEKELDAILMAWYPGQRGGDAVASVLAGDYNPAGRLPVTFYKTTDDLADFTDYNMRAGKGFTYRYFKGEALFPFGYGLSYTKFDYSNIQVNKTKIANNEELIVSFNIKNSGKYDGDEVIQLYIKDVKSNKWMAIKQLRKFKRVNLKKGETKKIEFKLNPKLDMRYYEPMKQNYMVEPGDFEIQIGASSSDIRLKKTIEVE
jgi:beta-glucosidase